MLLCFLQRPLRADHRASATTLIHLLHLKLSSSFHGCFHYLTPSPSSYWVVKAWRSLSISLRDSNGADVSYNPANPSGAPHVGKLLRPGFGRKCDEVWWSTRLRRHRGSWTTRSGCWHSGTVLCTYLRRIDVPLPLRITYGCMCIRTRHGSRAKEQHHLVFMIRLNVNLVSSSRCFFIRAASS
jgi:hypothetical protein